MRRREEHTVADAGGMGEKGLVQAELEQEDGMWSVQTPSPNLRKALEVQIQGQLRLC